jgi:hypothetical protein
MMIHRRTSSIDKALVSTTDERSHPGAAHAQPISYTASFAMIGVCSTLIGITKVAVHTRPAFTTAVDELFAIDSIGSLASGMLAYAATHTTHPRRSQRLMRLADRVFLSGMVVIAIGCVLMAFAIA